MISIQEGVIQLQLKGGFDTEFLSEGNINFSHAIVLLRSYTFSRWLTVTTAMNSLSFKLRSGPEISPPGSSIRSSVTQSRCLLFLLKQKKYKYTQNWPNRDHISIKRPKKLQWKHLNAVLMCHWTWYAACTQYRLQDIYLTIWYKKILYRSQSHVQLLNSKRALRQAYINFTKKS